MGLLTDVLNSDDGRLGMGLLAAAGPRADGAGFGQRLQEGMGSLDLWKQNQSTQKMADMQMQEMQAKVAQEKQLREMISRFSGSPGQPNQTSGFDYNGYADAMAAIDPVKALALKQSLIKQGPKFSTAPQYDQSGRAFVLAEDGQMKYLDGVKARDKLNEVRLGDKVGFRTDYSPEIMGSLPIGQSPDSKASNSIGWANYGLTKNRDALAASEGGKPIWNSETGSFIYKPDAKNPNGRVVPIDGAAGGKMTEDQAKASGWLVQASNAFGNMKNAMTKDSSAAYPGFNDALAAIPSMGLTSGVANMMRGPERQKFMQGASSLSEALLRAATGAGVNKDEALQKVQELTPVIGESDETTKQKMDAIPLYIESLKMRAGPGAKKVQLIMGNTGGASGSFGDGNKSTENGGWAIKKVQ